MGRDMAEQEKSREIIFILGGVRSGKSRHALKLAEAFGDRRLFVATAQALDQEMAVRIENHKKQRGDRWETAEEPVELVQILSEVQNRYDVILIDCLTLWVSNLLGVYGEAQGEIEDHIQDLIDCLGRSGTPVIVVSNEVGMGIVPDNPLARAFRDLAGMLNREVARVAGRVVFMVAGIPVVVKE